jgi:hypothetical protein
VQYLLFSLVFLSFFSCLLRSSLYTESNIDVKDGDDGGDAVNEKKVIIINHKICWNLSTVVLSVLNEKVRLTLLFDLIFLIFLPFDRL